MNDAISASGTGDTKVSPASFTEVMKSRRSAANLSTSCPPRRRPFTNRASPAVAKVSIERPSSAQANASWSCSRALVIA